MLNINIHISHMHLIITYKTDYLSRTQPYCAGIVRFFFIISSKVPEINVPNQKYIKNTRSKLDNSIYANSLYE